MVRYCGNCGAELSDGAKVCGQCGVPITSTKNKEGAASIPGISYVNPEKKEKSKKTFTLFMVIVVVVLMFVVLINYLSGFLGYKGTVRKFMNAYENYDVEVFTSIVSDWYYCTGDDSYAENYFKTMVSNDFNTFEETIGHKYKFSYQITDSYNLSKHKFEDLLEQLSVYEDFDTYIISEVMIVEVEITIDGEEKDMTMQKELYLTKEDDDWRILYIY